MKKLLLLIFMCCTFLGLEAQVSCDGLCSNATLEVERRFSCTFQTFLENDEPESSCLASGDGEVNWGDGSTTPVSVSGFSEHTYDNPGTYTVCMEKPFFITETETECIESFCEVIVVDICAPDDCNGLCFGGELVASEPDGCFVQVDLVNLILGSSCSSGGAEIDWGDGTITPASSSNGSHTYENEGTYSICFKLFGLPHNNPGPEGCTEYFCTVVETDNSCEPVDCDSQCFDGTIVASEPEGCNVQISLGDVLSPVACIPDGQNLIDWGDGIITPVSTTIESHTYENDGSFTICLRMPFINTVTEEECAEYICTDVLIEGCGPPAPCDDCFNNAEWYETSEGNNCYVNMYFGNYQAGSFCELNGQGEVDWGDGTTSPVSSLSTPNFNHTYTSADTYDVCITFQSIEENMECETTYCTEVPIANCDTDCNDCYVGGSFWATSTVGCNANFYFGNYDPSTVCPLAGDVTVDFGDGTTPFTTNHLQTPNFGHRYPCDDEYTACISFNALDSAGNVCPIEECATINIGNCGQCKWGETVDFSEVDISVYPNIISTSDHFDVRLNSSNVQEVKVYLFNLDGKMVQENTFHVSNGLQNLRITPNHLPSGQYIMQIVQAAASTSSGMVILVD